MKIVLGIAIAVLLLALGILFYIYNYNMVLGIEWWEGPSSNDLLVTDMINNSSSKW